VRGALRSCENVCGIGQRECIDGQWSECDASYEQECHNRCGKGIVRCAGGTIEPCDAAGEIECYSEECDSLGRQWCENDTPERICHTEVTVTCRSICGEGTKTCTDGQWTQCDAPRPKPPRLEVTVRDFHEYHPDFEFDDMEWKRVYDPGVVAVELGADEKPVYMGDPATPSTTGRENFDQWYRDVPDVNRRGSSEIELTEIPGRPGVYEYRNNSFFPIDGRLFGNEGNIHNYHFTVQIKTRFLYVGGETFSFSGDDDLWVFINGRLALDIGGVHVKMTDSVDLDAQAEQLRIEVGEAYDLHLFFAERHTIDSNFEIETTIAEWDFCD
jgi:fibro-slime domain-containing protein